MGSGALWRLTASELREAYRTGAVLPTEAVESCFIRLDSVNPALNAVVIVDREGARRAANASAERWRQGAALGPLDGIPITVKARSRLGQRGRER
jgi:aspartyl-tRNA(Asn)/glutamyl-tRNA(Gln) amidotransferase subunit A